MAEELPPQPREQENLVVANVIVHQAEVGRVVAAQAQIAAQ